MTLLVFFGCSFIAFGPSIAIFVITIVKFPLRVILLVFGAFFWLLSLLFSALLWLAVVPLRKELAFSLVFGVLFQEGFRFALLKMLMKADSGLDSALTDEEKKSISNHKASYVSGFGFGLMSGLFSIVNVLSISIGPGNVGIHGTTENFFLISSFLSNCFILLNTFWNVIAFNAVKKRSYFSIILIVCLHMLVSCLTLLNTGEGINYISLIVAYTILLVTVGWAFKVAGGSLHSIKSSFTC